jgi:ribosomal protein S18 acetylase RimI-like enzyme
MDDFPKARLRVAKMDDLAEVLRIEDESSALFANAGLDMSYLLDDHPFIIAERARLAQSTQAGMLQLALDTHGEPIGFIALSHVDDKPHIEQLSVAPICMRRGIGRQLLQHAFVFAESAGELWLTTYAHLPWNGLMYTRYGFQRVAEAECGAGIREILREQRAALPAPEQRIAMVRRGVTAPTAALV